CDAREGRVEGRGRGVPHARWSPRAARTTHADLLAGGTWPAGRRAARPPAPTAKLSIATALSHVAAPPERAPTETQEPEDELTGRLGTVALLLAPAAFTVYLSFNAGGFFPNTPAFVAIFVAV